MNRQTEINIQRLVDNELTETERIDLLRQADQHPHLWKEISLAMVEDRIWSGVVAETGRIESPISGAGTEKPVPRSEMPRWQWLGAQLMMTAAAAMLVFTLAIRWNQPPVAPGPGSPSAGPVAAQSGRSDPGPASNERLAVNREPWQLQVNDQVQVPLYSDPAQALEQWKQSNGQMDAEFQRLLLRAGYRMMPEVDYMTGNAADGRSFVVPIRQFRVRRYGQ